MGASIHLYFECKTDTWWEFVETDVSHPGEYDMMGCLFGIRNHCNFEPIAPPDRGIPDDASDQFERLKDTLCCPILHFVLDSGLYCLQS